MVDSEAQVVGESSNMTGACDDCRIPPHGHRTMYKMEDGFVYCEECLKDHGFTTNDFGEVFNK